MYQFFSSEKSKESSVRRKVFNKYGWILRKSRSSISIDNFGEYMIIDAYSNCIVRGSRFEYSLDDVIEFAEL